MAGKPILNGRDSVRKVLEMFRERGGQFAQIADSYYGLVIENFECEQGFMDQRNVFMDLQGVYIL